MAIGSSVYSRYEDIRLHHVTQAQYRIISGASATGDGVQLYFSSLNSSNSKEITSLTYPRKQRLYCTGKSDAYRNRITLEYHTNVHNINIKEPEGHAERNIIDWYAKNNNMKVLDIAASRYICCYFFDAIGKECVNLLSPISPKINR